MNRIHSPFCFEQLISAAQYIEKARSIPDVYLTSDDSSGDSFVNKSATRQTLSTCSIPSTSSLGCSSDRSSSSIPSPHHYPTSSPESNRRHQPYPSVTSARHSRTAHNELEKTRRANLRGYLDNLKDIVPTGCDNARNTTLSLLTRARDYIMELEKLISSAEEKKSQLEKHRSSLRLVLEGLNPDKTVAEGSRPGSAGTISVVDDHDYGIFSSSSSSVSSHTSSDSSTSCLDFSSKLSVSSSNSSVVSSPVHPYPPFDPYLNGLLPALPLCYPRISMYPYLDVQPL
ncbi:unnamed protein product [Thelazia callipaeda]|uniref:BHLH domain-containing protein n=1 Tax=Thelazia callipaeda TaxID=103827 RepID=A0A0N5D039_THECL|nr:unnamed protein product [Thelazia callipaeda]